MHKLIQLFCYLLATICTSILHQSLRSAGGMYYVQVLISLSRTVTITQLLSPNMITCQLNTINHFLLGANPIAIRIVLIYHYGFIAFPLNIPLFGTGSM